MSETSSMDESRKRQLVVRRDRDRARRQAKRTAEVWAMPANEVPTEEKGKYNTFFEVVEGYRKAIAEFKRGGCDWDRLDPLAREVKDKTSAWIRRMHPEYVQYFYYQYCEWCRDAMIDQPSPPNKRHVCNCSGRSFLRRASIRRGSVRWTPPCPAGRKGDNDE